MAARAGTNGSTPIAVQSGMTMGTTTAAEAVLLVVPEMRIASIVENAVIATTFVTGMFWDAAVPMVSASPVAARSEPKMMPVPKRMMVPQSILAASAQVSVARRSQGQRHEHGQAERGRGGGPLGEGDALARCLLDEAAAGEVGRRPHRCQQAADAGAVGEHQHQRRPTRSRSGSKSARTMPRSCMSWPITARMR